MKSRFAKMVVLGIKQFRDPYYQGFAAQMSFFIMLSLVPTLTVLSQLLGVLEIPLDFLDDWVKANVLPESAVFHDADCKLHLYQRKDDGQLLERKNQITEDHGLDLIYAGLRCYYTCIRKIDFTGRIRSYYRGNDD